MFSYSEDLILLSPLSHEPACLGYGDRRHHRSVIGAFGKIDSSLVCDVLMPPLGLLMANVDFSSLFIDLSRTSPASLALAKAAGAPILNYGGFLQRVFDFLIIALLIFIMIKQVNPLRQDAPRPPPPPGPTNEEKSFMEIRDLRKARQ